MMRSGKTGMGTAKHRKSGRAPKSPKLRHAMKRAAEQDVKKGPVSFTTWFDDPKKVFSSKRR